MPPITPTPFRAPAIPFPGQRMLARARQYRRVAMPSVDMEGPDPNWPKWFLVTHAMELAIKAYIVWREDANVPPPAAPKPANHDLVAQYDYAVSYGLTRDPQITSDLPHLSDLHRTHYARYPDAAVKPVALIAQYDDMVDKLFDDVGNRNLLAFRQVWRMNNVSSGHGRLSAIGSRCRRYRGVCGLRLSGDAG
jgi:hypothetical protein